MRSKIRNNTVLVISLLIMNVMGATVIRPVNIFGIMIMNIAAVTVILVALRIQRKPTML